MPARSPEAKARRRANAAERMRSFRQTSQDYRDREIARAVNRHEWWGLDCILNVLDGEADTIGHYNLLQVYDGTQVYTLRAGRGHSLGCLRIIRWLFEIAQYQRTRYGTHRRIVWCMFGMGYDLDQWIGHEPGWTVEEKLSIAKQKARGYGTVRKPGWRRELDFPAQHLSVYAGRKTAIFRHLDSRRKIELWDVWSLVACSFVAAMESYLKTQRGTSHEAVLMRRLALVRRGKAERGTWQTMDARAIESYNLAELYLLHSWLSHELANLAKVGLAPKSIAGPAPIARASDRAYGLLEHVKPIDYDTVEYQEGEWMAAVRASYFGGWIECAVQGVLEESWEADLTSAYPWQETLAPCGAHGQARKLTPEEIAAACRGELLSNALYEIVWQFPLDQPAPRFAPFPARSFLGTISNRWQGRGTYHTSLVAAFLANDQGARWRIESGWLWESTCAHEHPFAEAVGGMFSERQRLLAAGDSSQQTLKLALNSRYGLRAQTSGAARLVNDQGETIGYTTPRHSNLFLASYVTSGVRAELYRVASTEGENVFGMATDAIFFHRKPASITVPDTKQLGQFELTRHDRTAYVMPGVRFEESGAKKTRGYSVPISYAALVNAWQNEATELCVPVLVYQDLRASALADGTLKPTWGTFQKQGRILDLTAGVLLHKRDITAGQACVRLGVPVSTGYVYYPPYRNDLGNVAYTRPIDVDAMAAFFDRETPAEEEYAE